MQEDWHTTDTTTEKIVPQMFKHPKRAVHFITDPKLKFLVECYALNRKDKDAAAKTWGWVEEHLLRFGRG